MAATGLQEEEVFRQGGSAPNLREAVFTVATRANDHLITAREMLKNLKGGLDVGHEFEHSNEEEHGVQSTRDERRNSKTVGGSEERIWRSDACYLDCACGWKSYRASTLMFSIQA